MNKESLTPLCYTARLEILFWKIRTEESKQRHIRKKKMCIPFEKISDYFNNLDVKKVCDKKHGKR